MFKRILPTAIIFCAVSIIGIISYNRFITAQRTAADSTLSAAGDSTSHLPEQAPATTALPDSTAGTVSAPLGRSTMPADSSR